jgi:hypothetical protein
MQDHRYQNAAKMEKKMSVPLFEVIWYGKPFVPLFGHA